ncbi:MAG: ribonuclease P protein component [Candidatus Kerfeldbacteria bacterium]|nr:ribonuclease P protein component [Candidatus Kerfeldbacteria bacterium]
MLPRSHRLLATRDFQRAYRRGRSAHSRTLRLRTLAHGRPVTRFGIVVSNRIAKRAVVRNRLKRRLRESVRPLLPRILPGFDVILSAQPGADAASLVQLRQDLQAVLVRARLIRP